MLRRRLMCTVIRQWLCVFRFIIRLWHHCLVSAQHTTKITNHLLYSKTSLKWISGNSCKRSIISKLRYGQLTTRNKDGTLKCCFFVKLHWPPDSLQITIYTIDYTSPNSYCLFTGGRTSPAPSKQTQVTQSQKADAITPDNCKLEPESLATISIDLADDRVVKTKNGWCPAWLHKHDATTATPTNSCTEWLRHCATSPKYEHLNFHCTEITLTLQQQLWTARLYLQKFILRTCN